MYVSARGTGIAICLHAQNLSASRRLTRFAFHAATRSSPRAAFFLRSRRYDAAFHSARTAHESVAVASVLPRARERSRAWRRCPAPTEVEAVTLANGMQIIVWPDHDIPNVALYNWVRVGSRNEVPGITGLAHFFEHMMFNGTSTRAPGEFDRVLEANGARNNAFTSSDVTVYQDWFPRAALETVFDLEADRLRNLAFDPKVIESERGVVYSERRLRVDDSHLRTPAGAGAGDRVRRASLRHSDHRLAVRHRVVDDRRSEDVLRDLLRAEQLHAGAGRRRRSEGSRSRWHASTSKPIPRAATAPSPYAPRSRSSRASAASSSTPMRRRRCCSSPITASPAQIRASPRSNCWRASSPTAMPRACIARWSRNRRSRSPPTATSKRASIRDSCGFSCRCPRAAIWRSAEAAFDAADRARHQARASRRTSSTRARNQALADFWRGLATIDGKAQALGTYAVLQGGYEKTLRCAARL